MAAGPEGSLWLAWVGFDGLDDEIFASHWDGKDLERPEFWGGYRLVPRTIEFWQGRANRLHDRLLFTRDGEAWTVSRLAP